jgi:hypothetical protein
LKDAVMALLRIVAGLKGGLTVRAIEFGEIDFRRATDAAAGTAQTGPDFRPLKKIGFGFEQSVFDHLTGRKGRPFPGYRAASGTDTALHTVINLFLS